MASSSKGVWFDKGVEVVSAEVDVEGELVGEGFWSLRVLPD